MMEMGLPGWGCLSPLPACIATEALEPNMPHFFYIALFSKETGQPHEILNSSIIQRKTGQGERVALVIKLRTKRWGFLGLIFLCHRFALSLDSEVSQQTECFVD